MHDRWRRLARIGTALVSLPAPALADVVTFTRGGQVEARAEVRGAAVTLTTPGGRFEFARGDLRTIVPAPLPEEEWPARASEALAGDARGRFEAAWWALEHGLTPEATAMLRAALAADPAHRPAARMVAMLDRLAGDRPDPDLDSITRALGGRSEVARGPHVVLLHQHDPAEAAARVDLLERVVTTYYLAFAAWGVDLPVPGRRLPSAWFARQEDYLTFLHAEDADAFRPTRGYYHPTRRLVVAYDARSGEPQRPAREALAAARRRPGSPRDEVARRAILFDLECRSIDVSTAAHEMAHQLVDASGLCPRPDAFPVWVHEGFATQFEVVRAGRWAGFGRADDFRLPYWRRLVPPPRLASVLRDAGFGRGYHPDRYAEAWALVYFLRKEHPREFLAFLDQLRVPTTEGPARDHLGAFHDAFGAELGDLESRWHRFLGGVRTPAEEASRRSGSPTPVSAGGGPAR